MSNLRCKWVGRWDAGNRQFRFFRVMWEELLVDGKTVFCSHKVSVSLKRWLPRVTHRVARGGIYV